MKIISEKSLTKGEQGVLFCELYYKKKFKRATREEDIKLGIDCYIDNIPTDVKNTKEVFFAQINKHTKTYNIRHPFKLNTKATHYCFVDVGEDIKEGILIEHISVLDKLKQYVKEETIPNLLARLQEFDQKPISNLGVSLQQSAYQFKLMFLPYLRDNVSVKYLENENDISFTFYERKTQIVNVAKTQQKNNSIQAIKDLLQKHRENSTEKGKKIPILRETIIKVKI